MTPFTLKSHQPSALDALATYSRTARIKGPATAFARHAGRSCSADAFGPVMPCAGLRIPNGGSKTMLAAHAVPLLAAAPHATEKSQRGALGMQASPGRAVFGWLTRRQAGKDLQLQFNAVLA